MKRSCVHEEDVKAKLKYQNLLSEFFQLQKEFVSHKRKLQAAKQRRSTILNEILFLKKRRSCLLKSQPSREVLRAERSGSDCDAALGTAHSALASKFNLSYAEPGDDEVLAGKAALRLECASKNYFIDDKRVGKKHTLGMVK